MWRKKILFGGVVVSGFVMVLLASSLSEAAGNCQSKLLGKTYNCTVEDQDFGEDAFTFVFKTGGFSRNFDLFIDSAEYGCSCNTTGSVGSPKFNSSSSNFECISTNDAYLINGKVNGKKISGQGTAKDGDGIIFSCKVM
jgi:hypothetical protein